MRNEPPAGRPPPQPGSAGRHRDVVVNHQECMAILLGSVQGRAGDSTLAARERREAEEHVSRCSDCWAVLSLLHELATGEPAPGAERMGALFGCGPVQDEMYLLAGLTAEEIRRRHPHVARHLGWCHACRDRVAEVMTIERAAARGDLGPPLVAGDEPPRLSVHVREIRGEGIELVGRYSVRGAAMVVVKGLTPGQYVLEIEDKQRARRFRLRFDIESSA